MRGVSFSRNLPAKRLRSGEKPDKVLTKRFSVALAGLFYGFLLSKVILTPLAARLES